MAVIRSTSLKPLLGGVFEHASTPFECEAHALGFAEVVEKTNREAGRKCCSEVVPVEAEERRVIKADFIHPFEPFATAHGPTE
jgi:hypothetical protein